MNVEQLEKMVSPVLLGLGYQLFDIELASGVLRFYIEKHDYTSVTIDDCVLVSQQLSRLLLVENIDYENLEVSSPGTDRTLTKPEHFQRYQGEEVKLRLYQSLAPGRHSFKGKIHCVLDQGIQLETDGEELLEFAFEDIQKARLIPQWRRHK